MNDEGYGMITYTSDRFGLRNSNKKWINLYKKSNIFLICDSFVAGWSVPKSSTISNNIEVLTKTNTLNLGSGGNDPYEYMAILKSIINPIVKNSDKLQIVVIIFYSNDNKPRNFKKEKLLSSLGSIINLSDKEEASPTDYYINNIKDFIKNNFNNSQQDIISKLKKRNFRYSPLVQLVTLYPITKRVRGFLVNLSLKRPDIKSYTYSTSQKSILLLSEVCQNKCEPIVAFIPHSNALFPYLESKKYKMELKSMSKKLNIPFIDGENIISSNKLDDYSPKGGHLSKKGYKKIADSISEEIIKIGSGTGYQTN